MNPSIPTHLSVLRVCNVTELAIRHQISNVGTFHNFQCSRSQSTAVASITTPFLDCNAGLSFPSNPLFIGTRDPLFLDTGEQIRNNMNIWKTRPRSLAGNSNHFICVGDVNVSTTSYLASAIPSLQMSMFRLPNNAMPRL